VGRHVVTGLVSRCWLCHVNTYDSSNRRLSAITCTPESTGTIILVLKGFHGPSFGWSCMNLRSPYGKFIVFTKVASVRGIELRKEY